VWGACVTDDHCLPVGLVYMTLPTVMLQVPGCLRGELLME
jgi:hypothetical protein